MSFVDIQNNEAVELSADAKMNGVNKLKMMRAIYLLGFLIFQPVRADQASLG